MSRSFTWASVDDDDPARPGARRPLSTSLLNLLPLVILVGAVSADRFGIRWQGVNLRLELIAAGLLLLWGVVTWRVAGLRIGLIEWCLLGWLAVGALSSLLFSPAPRESLRLTLLLVGMVAIYGVTAVFLRSRADLVRAAVVFVGVGTAVAAIGIVEAILYALFDSHLGITFDPSAAGAHIEFVPRVTSTMWEANILGSYLLIVWALAFALSRVPAARTPGRTWAFRIVMAIVTAGIVISTTRVVWVVAPLLMLSMLAVCLKAGILPRRALLANFLNANLAGIAVGLALVTAMSVVDCPMTAASSVPAATNPGSAPPSASNPLLGPGCVRGGSVFVQQGHGYFAAQSTSSFTGRFEVAKLALKGWLHRPVFGNGTGSFLYVYGPKTSGWIGNLPLHILFDTGIVGFLFLLAALLAAGRAAVRAVRKVPTLAWKAPHYVVFGLLAAGVALLATYEFTEGTWLGFTWVFLGMLVVGGRLLRGIGPRLRSA